MSNVVHFPATGSLGLRQIVKPNGVGVISLWLAANPGALARFRVRVRDLNRIPRVDWHTKQFRFLKGNAGLAEIKWKWSNREWRVFGYFNTAGYFVTVMGCTHKERYDPPDCLNTANRRMQEAQRGEWEICIYEP
jgi:hypothetical protein